MVGNRFLALLSNMFTNLKLTDIETGYKAFRASVIKSLHLEEDRVSIEPEIWPAHCWRAAVVIAPSTNCVNPFENLPVVAVAEWKP